MALSGSKQSSLSRRGFVQGAALAGGAMATGLLGRPGSEAKAFNQPGNGPIELAENDVILLQGDSITDAGRNKGQQAPNDLGGLGYGYAMMISTGLLGAHAPLKLQCYNRGISGHKVPDLANRWDGDCVNLNPRVVSILIGVNDLWHNLNNDHNAIVEQYEEGYAALLQRTREALPEAAIVVCEPFVLRCGHVNESWFPGFDNLRAAARRVSDGADAIFVPFQSMFDEAVTESTPADYWAGDGVHPSTAGHALMARTWLETTGLA